MHEVDARASLEWSRLGMNDRQAQGPGLSKDARAHGEAGVCRYGAGAVGIAVRIPVDAAVGRAVVLGGLTMDEMNRDFYQRWLPTEVTRLRAENALLKEECVMSMGEIAMGRAENERLRDALEQIARMGGYQAGIASTALLVPPTTTAEG